MGNDFVAWIVQQVGLAGVAALSLWMLNRVWELRVEELKRNSEDIREVWRETKDALNRNTEALVRLQERLEQHET